MAKTDLKNSYIYEGLGRDLQKMSSLSHLKIINPRAIPLSPQFLRVVLYHCENLVSMTITARGFTQSRHHLHLPHVPESMTTKLEHLDVVDCRLSIANLRPLLEDCPKLKFLAVMKEGNMEENKTALAECCPKLQHLHYRPWLARGHILAIPKSDDVVGAEYKEGQRVTGGICLHGLYIDVTDAHDFLDQWRIKVLRLASEQQHWLQDTSSTVEQLIIQNLHTLEILDLSLPVNPFQALVPLFKFMDKLKLLQLHFKYERQVVYSTMLGILGQISGMASRHPTLQSISLSITPFPGNAPFVTHGATIVHTIASIAHLKQIEIVLWEIKADDLALLFEKARNLERITLNLSPLIITERMFTALASLPLHTLVLVSGRVGSLNDNGLIQFIDHHAGPLMKMSLRGDIRNDRNSASITYAYQKLGTRFQFH